MSEQPTITPCPACGTEAGRLNSGWLACPNPPCPIDAMPAPMFARLSRAARLLAAVEGLDVFLHRPASTAIQARQYGQRIHAATHTAHAGYDMARDAVWSDSLADALIALAASLEAPDAE